jgi:hypothetical protein
MKVTSQIYSPTWICPLHYSMQTNWDFTSTSMGSESLLTSKMHLARCFHYMANRNKHWLYISRRNVMCNAWQLMTVVVFTTIRCYHDTWKAPYVLTVKYILVTSTVYMSMEKCFIFLTASEFYRSRLHSAFNMYVIYLYNSLCSQVKIKFQDFSMTITAFNFNRLISLWILYSLANIKRMLTWTVIFIPEMRTYDLTRVELTVF